MSDSNSVEYFLARQRQAILLSQAASDTAVKAIHLNFADEYGRRAMAAGAKPLRVVEIEPSSVSRG